MRQFNIFSAIILFILPLQIVRAQLTDSPESRMRKALNVLASDSLQGREAGSAGGNMASVFVAKSMENVGLQPHGDSTGSYYNHFVMNYPVVFKDGQLKVNNVKFKYIEEFGGTDLSAGGNVSAPIVFIENQLLTIPGTLEAMDFDVNGKVVVFDINPGKPEVSNQQIVFMTARRVEFFAGQGAVAVILHNSAKQPYEDALFGSSSTIALNIPVIYIARLPYERLHRQRKHVCTLAISVDRNAQIPVNVVGIVDNHAQKNVIVGAHYDHLGAKKSKELSEQAPKIFNGADDNGSGTVVLLELARWAAANHDLNYNYIFVAFNAEEKGLFGSKAFASNLDRQKDNIAYMLNLDMVGRLGCQGDTLSVLGVGTSPVWQKLLDTVAHPAFDLKMLMGAPNFSDHAPFVKKEIPVIYFTTGTHKEYHTPADDVELINFKGMAEIVEYLGRVIADAEKVGDIPFQKLNAFQQTRALLSVF